MNNRQRNKIILFLFLLVTISSSMLATTVSGESQTIDYTEEIRWFGVYDEFPQVTLEAINQYFDQILEVGSTDLHQKDIIDLFGEPSGNYSAGASDFLIYYSINDAESVILYFQLFSEEKVGAISQGTAVHSDSDASSVDSDPMNDSYLIEVNKLVLNQSHFEPLKISSEEVKAWQDASDGDRRITDIDELVDIIGMPSEVMYNFEQEVWTYTWYRTSEKVDGLTYLSAEVASDNTIQSIQSLDNSKDKEEE